MEERHFRNAMGKFATGVTVILTDAEGGVHGMTANAFMSVSLSPRLVIISIGEKARILEKIKKSKAFSVNVLADDQQRISMIFSGQLKDHQDVVFHRLDGKPVLPGALAQISCEVSGEHVEGDHTLFIGRVTEVNLNNTKPLIYYNGRYRLLAEEKTE